MTVKFEHWLKWISGRVRQARKEAGLTRKVLAERAGLREDFIRLIEEGQFSPGYLGQEKIARACGIDASFFEPQGTVDAGRSPDA